MLPAARCHNRSGCGVSVLLAGGCITHTCKIHSS